MRNVSQPIFSVIIVLLSLSVVLFIGGVLIGVDQSVITKAIIICLGLGCIFIALVVRDSRYLQSAVKQFHLNDVWTHWRYSSQFWQTYAPQEWLGAPMQFNRKYWQQLMVGGIVLMILAGFIGWFWSRQELNPGVMWQTIILSGLSVGIYFAIMSYVSYRQAIAVPMPETVDLSIGSYGIYIRSSYEQLVPFQMLGVAILDAQVATEDQPMLQIRMRYENSKANDSILSIPIPEGHIEEAHVLATKILPKT